MVILSPPTLRLLFDFFLQKQSVLIAEKIVSQKANSNILELKN